MSLPSPSTQTIADNIVAQIAASISQSVPLLPKAFIRVLAKVLAGVFVLLWKYCGFIFLQLFVAYASADPTTINGKVVQPLVEWGRLIGVGDPLPSVQAELLISVVVKNQTGSLAARSSLVRSSTGVIYQTIAEVPLDAPTVPVRIRAVSDQSGGDGSGIIGNLQAGDVVEFANPLPNVSKAATVVSQTVTGANAELIELYRARIVARFQSAPQGGAYADYRDWAEEVPGIVNVYPYAGDPGEVDVYVEASVETSGSADGIPTGAQLTAAEDAIELDIAGVASRRPVNAAVNVLPILRTGFSIVIFGLDTPDEADVKASISQGVDEYLRALEPFIVGLSTLPRKDRVTQTSVASVVNDIVSSAGGAVSSVSLLEGGGAIASRNLGAGEKAKLESVTYS
jgi:hypothetical protein